jgi:hypothetical protein
VAPKLRSQRQKYGFGVQYRVFSDNPGSSLSSTQRRVDITIWTPRYSCPLPYRVEEDAESATLISGRIQILIVLRGELIIREERNRVTWTFLVKFDTGRKNMD